MQKRINITINETLINSADRHWQKHGFVSRSEYIASLIRNDIKISIKDNREILKTWSSVEDMPLNPTYK